MNPVTKICSSKLDELLGCTVVLASESFQITGSFKYRAALNVVSRLPHPLFITASSGNFGQALACACQRLGRQCIIVMPRDSAQVKISAVRSYGGQVELIDVRSLSRGDKVNELMRLHPDAYKASAFDDPLVIEGNASLGRELAGFPESITAVLAPIGGGGLTAGLVQGLRQANRPIPVWAAEPAQANDASQSLAARRLISLPAEPRTLADGVRSTCLGQHNWDILKEGLSGVLEVSESSIAQAVRLLFEKAHLKTEPTGALSVAALLCHPEKFQGQTVACVISGANVDTKLFQTILSGTLDG